MQSDIDMASIIATTALLISIISLIFSYLTYNQSLKEYSDLSKKDIINNLDKCYIFLNSFIKEYVNDEYFITGKENSRQNILYLLETIRVEFESSQFIKEEIINYYADITIKISDITYEINPQLAMVQLSEIKEEFLKIKRAIYM